MTSDGGGMYSLAQLMADWAHLLPQKPIPGRVEVGAGMLAHLELLCPPVDQGHLLAGQLGSFPGTPVIENPDLPPLSWRMYDTDGNVMASDPETT